MAQERETLLHRLYHWFDSPENSNTGVWRVFSIGGLVVTVAMWMLLIRFPVILRATLSRKLLGFLFFLPPFFSAISLGRLLIRQRESETDADSGVMSSYNNLNRSSRDWKLVIAAGMLGALNVYFMMFCE